MKSPGANSESSYSTLVAPVLGRTARKDKHLAQYVLSLNDHILKVELAAEAG